MRPSGSRAVRAAGIDGATILGMSAPKPAKAPASGQPRFQPHPDDAADLGAASEEADSGELLSAEESEAYIRWLETGQGPPASAQPRR